MNSRFSEPVRTRNISDKINLAAFAKNTTRINKYECFHIGMYNESNI